MARFLMLWKYSSDAIKGISADRTKKATAIVEKAGGKISSAYALLGSYDLALVVDLPGIQDALKVSVAMTKITDVGFTTMPAITVEEFDKLMA